MPCYIIRSDNTQGLNMDRRNFLKSSLALSGAPAFLNPQSRGKYKTALIGAGWWGMNILREAIQSGECRIVGACDVDENQLNPAVEEITKLSGDQPRKYKDFRDLLAKEAPEIVIVATPDHWHALTAIAAIEKGAHVYLEKPICHTIQEGRAILNAARAANRVVQVGTHRRVSPHNISGMEFLRSGRAGKIGMVRCFVHSAQRPQPPTPDSDPPAGLDWDFWCGPAPKKPFNRSIHPRGFRQHLEYANGTLGDWGIHWFDQVLWWTEEKWPKRVFSTGGRPIMRDATNAPDTQVASFEFESFTCVWEHRRYGGNQSEKHSLGAYFYGTEGVFHMGWRDGWTFYPADPKKPTLHEEPKLNAPDDQNIRELFADFLNCIKTGKRPASDIEFGYRATVMSLLGMLSLRLGRSVQWDGDKELCAGDGEANRLLRRDYRPPWKYPPV